MYLYNSKNTSQKIKQRGQHRLLIGLGLGSPTLPHREREPAESGASRCPWSLLGLSGHVILSFARCYCKWSSRVHGLTERTPRRGYSYTIHLRPCPQPRNKVKRLFSPPKGASGRTAGALTLRLRWILRNKCGFDRYGGSVATTTTTPLWALLFEGKPGYHHYYFGWDGKFGGV